MYVPGSGDLEQGLSIGVDLKLIPFRVPLIHDQIVSRPFSTRWLIHSIDLIRLQSVIEDAVISSVHNGILALVITC